MKMWNLVFLVLFSSSLTLAQAVPEDVFLEAPTDSQAPPPTDDLPPNEPPYTQSPDELEAQKLLQAEPAPEAKPANTEKAKQVETEIDSKSGRQKIAHPDSNKGLYLIDQNTGKYYYKTKKMSQKNQSTSFRIGTITRPNITAEYGGNTYDFSQFYSDDDIPFIMLDYEWQPFRSFGKFGLVMGVGFFTASGNGKFVDPSIEGGAPAREGFTFIGLPLSAGLIYRFEFSDRQWFAPFVTGGGSYYILGEIRDDNKAPKFVGTPAAYGGGGILFNLTAWDKDIAFTMDREYGISNMWIAFEYRTVQSLNKDLDVSSDIFNVGISVDY